MDVQQTHNDQPALMAAIMADLFSLTPTAAVLDKCGAKHPEVPRHAWRQGRGSVSDMFVAFHDPERYLIEALHTLDAPRAPTTPVKLKAR